MGRDVQTRARRAGSAGGAQASRPMSTGGRAARRPAAWAALCAGSRARTLGALSEELPVRVGGGRPYYGAACRPSVGGRPADVAAGTGSPAEALSQTGTDARPEP
ncbi:hypothetical protein GCM10010236_73790 [Streptomyces eurythermus]|nr:hypothetical protein GCM10010236_73790 [Streptomyces eurythermus]